MDDLKLTKEEKGRNFTVCLYRQRFAFFYSKSTANALTVEFVTWNQSYCTWFSVSGFDNTFTLNIQYTSLDSSHTLCFKPQIIWTVKKEFLSLKGLAFKEFLTDHEIL